MSYREVLVFPNKKLKMKSSPVVEFNDDIKLLAQDLVDTCNVANGIGLAAPQIGVQKRMLVIDCKKIGVETPEPYSSNEDYWVLVNPQLKLLGEEFEWTEACLSVPNVEYSVGRNTAVQVTYQNVDGAESTIELERPLSGVLQHECDHLDGVLYIDRLSRLKRGFLVKRMNKISRKQQKYLEQLRLDHEDTDRTRRRRRRRRK